MFNKTKSYSFIEYRNYLDNRRETGRKTIPYNLYCNLILIALNLLIQPTEVVDMYEVLTKTTDFSIEVITYIIQQMN